MKKVVLKSRIVALGIAALFTVSLTAWAFDLTHYPSTDRLATRGLLIFREAPRSETHP